MPAVNILRRSASTVVSGWEFWFKKAEAKRLDLMWEIKSFLSNRTGGVLVSRSQGHALSIFVFNSNLLHQQKSPPRNGLPFSDGFRQQPAGPTCAPASFCSVPWRPPRWRWGWTLGDPVPCLLRGPRLRSPSEVPGRGQSGCSGCTVLEEKPPSAEPGGDIKKKKQKRCYSTCLHYMSKMILMKNNI